MPSHAHTASPGFTLGTLPEIVTRLYQRQRAHFIAARTRRALAALTPRELEDIGVTPADIDRVAARSAGL